MSIDKLPPGTPFPAAAVTEQRGTAYPDAFQPLVDARIKRRLGDVSGLDQFGVNLVHLSPGAWSSQRHWHTTEDEFLYVLSGELVLATDAGETSMHPGDCAGFKAGDANGHHLVNRTGETATYLEVGTRRPDGITDYPDIDMQNIKRGGKSSYVNRKGEPY